MSLPDNYDEDASLAELAQTERELLQSSVQPKHLERWFKKSESMPPFRPGNPMIKDPMFEVANNDEADSTTDSHSDCVEEEVDS